MQASIGKMLSEKRAERGLSLEEAAEATRIRIDYLAAIEKDALDFDLPDIYRRGFLKTYAEYLGLDPQEAMEACPIPSYEALNSSEKRREMVSTIARRQAAYVAIEPEAAGEETAAENGTSAEMAVRKFPQRAVLVIASTTAILLLAIAGMWLLAHRPAGRGESAATAPSFEKIAPHREILLRARGAVKLIVRDRDTKERIYTGSLKDGEERYIEYEKPIQVYYDRGELLSVEMANGEVLHPDRGRGGIEIK